MYDHLDVNSRRDAVYTVCFPYTQKRAYRCTVDVQE